ncbi:MAG: glycosyltransferase [Candidatus Hydrogenedentota bacterium]
MRYDGVTILITNWNGKKLILPCIRDAINSANLYKGPVELLVIDDFSSDDSVSAIQQEFPSVNIFVNEKNLGVGGAINVGFEKAMYDYVILLNNDCYLRGDYITPMMDTINRFNPQRVFAVMSRVYENDSETPGGGLSRAYIHYGLLRVRWATEGKYLEKESYTFYATSGAMFSKKKWLELGGMDPLFKPFYSEDVDISYRAWKRGWLIIYQPKSKLIHNQGTTIKSNFSKKLIRFSSQKNRFLFFYKNMDDFLFNLNHWSVIFFRLLEFFIKCDFKVIIEIIKMWSKFPYFNNHKQKENLQRRLTDRDILSISSKWYFTNAPTK